MAKQRAACQCPCGKCQLVYVLGEARDIMGKPACAVCHEEFQAGGKDWDAHLNTTPKKNQPSRRQKFRLDDDLPAMLPDAAKIAEDVESTGFSVPSVLMTLVTTVQSGSDSSQPATVAGETEPGPTFVKEPEIPMKMCNRTTYEGALCKQGAKDGETACGYHLAFDKRKKSKRPALLPVVKSSPELDATMKKLQALQVAVNLDAPLPQSADEWSKDSAQLEDDLRHLAEDMANHHRSMRLMSGVKAVTVTVTVTSDRRVIVSKPQYS